MTPFSLTEALRALEDGSTSAEALVDAAAARVAADDERLGVFVTTTLDRARERAADVDARRARGEAVGVLGGVPLAIKDIIFTADAPTSGQSVVRDDSPTGDAPVSARLRAADAALVGKTTTMEFALGFSDPDKPFPTPRNPWDDTRWTGGSSSGTASGISAGMFYGGLGTDTAGSIRMPAAWCGVTGHMPTYGLVPRTGVLPLGWTLDHVGPLARTAEDCSLLLSVIAGPDGVDGTVDPARRHAHGPTTLELPGLRIGLALDPLELSVPGVQRRTREAADTLAAAGADVREVRLPHYTEGRDATMLGLAAEALAYHRNDAVSRWHDFGRATRGALLTGALLSGADYVQVLRVRRHLQRRLAELFSHVDLVIAPTAASPAPPVDGLDFAEVVGMLQTHYWDATGHPALSVPMGPVDGLPTGLQIVAPAFEDRVALDAGRLFQQLTTHHLALPPTAATDGDPR